MRTWLFLCLIILSRATWPSAASAVDTPKPPQQLRFEIKLCKHSETDGKKLIVPTTLVSKENLKASYFIGAEKFVGAAGDKELINLGITITVVARRTSAGDYRLDLEASELAEIKTGADESVVQRLTTRGVKTIKEAKEYLMPFKHSSGMDYVVQCTVKKVKE